jgi:hypothetical protein
MWIVKLVFHVVVNLQVWVQKTLFEGYSFFVFRCWVGHSMKEVWIFFIFQSLTCADRVNSCCALWSVDVLVYSCDQWSYLRINCLATLSFTWRRYRTLPSWPVQMLKELDSNFYHVHFSMWRDDSVQESMKPSNGVSAKRLGGMMPGE